MSRAVRLCRASLLAAVVAVACGTDTIDLLPPGAGGSMSGASGSAGSVDAGRSSGGSGDVAGTSAAGFGGSAAGSGGVSGASGCGGFGCGGFGSSDGFGGDAGGCKDFETFCPCGPQERCGLGTKCNARLGLCMRKCDSPFDCGGEGFLCEDHSCGLCSEDEQCEQYGSFERRVCVDELCEQCEGPSDCPEDEPMCIGRRCIQCLNNEDCSSGVCNKPRGRCEK